MSYKDAEKIVNAFGKTLEEVQKRRFTDYPLKFPQSLLPYPKEKIKDALIISQKIFEIINGKLDKDLSAGLIFLEDFIDDQEAYKINSRLLKRKEYWEALKKK